DAKNTMLALYRRGGKEGFGALKDNYGSVPAEATSWIREVLGQRFEGYAKGRGASLAQQRTQMHVPTTGVQEQLDTAALRAKRDLEIALQPIELRARLGSIAKGDLPSVTTGNRDVDAFISHASEDKAMVARPLADELTARGFIVWLDEYEIKIGDSIYNSIDDGLRRARFGVVILSHSFFAKNWTRRELGALAALGDAEGTNKILPIWHNLEHSDVAGRSPLLADLLAVRSSEGIATVADRIATALGTPDSKA